MSLHLAIELDDDGPQTPERLVRTARRAENAGFTLATFDDALLSPGRIGAVERAAFVASQTSVLGLAPVVPTTYNEPFHVSSQLASLDFAAAGRAGWVVATSPQAEVARAWGRPPAGDLEREARDAVEVTRALWDSWEDDAAIRDVASGRYLDAAKLHYVDFVGGTYSVKGPAIVPRPPQGQLVVLAPAGLLPDGQADVTLLPHLPPDLARDFAVSRTPNGTRDAEIARDLTRGSREGLAFLELDVALDTDDGDAVDRAEQWADSGRPRHVGTSAGLVALLTGLAGAVDGVRLHPLGLDDDLAELSARVLPALFATCVATRPVAGSSLRTTLGLARPANRFVQGAV